MSAKSKLAAPLALCAGVVALVASDRRTSGVLETGSVLHEPAWSTFGELETRVQGRAVLPGSMLDLGGLWPDSEVQVTAALVSSDRARPVEIWANGGLAFVTTVERPVGRRFAPADFSARADAKGHLRLRVVAPEGHVRVVWVRYDQPPPAHLPARRFLGYALGLLFAAVVACGLGLPAVWFAGVTALAGAAVVWWDRTAVYSNAWAIAPVVAAGAVAWVTRLLGSPRDCGVLLVIGFLLRALVGLHPRVEPIDLQFHVHNLVQYAAGHVVTSAVTLTRSVRLEIPYPPALYAVLAPVVARVGGPASAMRWACVLFEGTLPLLAWGLVHRAGGSVRAAWMAAGAAAAMPSGVVALVEGPAANVFGGWSSVVTLVAAVGGSAFLVVAGLSALAFLAHPGSAVSLGLLAGLWTASWRLRDRLARAPLFLLGAFGLGAVLAWAAYYREVGPLTAASLQTIGRQASSPGSGFFEVGWINLWKLVLDSGFKFGLGPVWLAVVGLRSGTPPPPIRTLLTPWFALAAALGALTMVSPLWCRFEYFVAPAVAVAAGLGAEFLEEAHRAVLARSLLWVGILCQAAVGLWLVCGGLPIINLVIPSGRWYWPHFGCSGPPL